MIIVNVCYYLWLQLFVLSADVLMSLVELPALSVPGGGVTAGLVTAPSQVRVILRDLAGKACWDASILYCTPEQLKHKGTICYRKVHDVHKGGVGSGNRHRINRNKSLDYSNHKEY